MKNESDLHLNHIQKKIIEILQKEGSAEIEELSNLLQIKRSDLERELAALRHVEKIGGELRDGKRFICLWPENDSRGLE